MRLHILSDLHLEFARWEISATDADVIVLAGDIHTGQNGLKWIRAANPVTPVIYVLGNHEYYGQMIPNLTHHLKAAAAGTNVRVLENDRVDIGDVTFLGTTLWTDFALNGDPVVGGTIAENVMNDFHRIRTAPGFRKLRAPFVRRLNAESVLWLRQQCGVCRDRKVVVVTHHPPSARSIATQFAGEPANVAFASHLDGLVAESRAVLWVHGHTHRAFDYMIESTRVVANQRGYPHESTLTGFRGDFVVEI